LELLSDLGAACGEAESGHLLLGGGDGAPGGLPGYDLLGASAGEEADRVAQQPPPKRRGRKKTLSAAEKRAKNREIQVPPPSPRSAL
jgi:hypothetical protein